MIEYPPLDLVEVLWVEDMGLKKSSDKKESEEECE
jgi:hypothetical protein